MPRFQLRIRWLMLVVAGAAVVLALPRPFAEILGTLAAIPATMIGLGALFAPRGRKKIVAAWVAALHPLALLAWLMLVRSTWCRRPLYPIDNSLVFQWTLEIPYIAVLFANVIVLPALFFGAVVSTVARQTGRTVRVFAVPLVFIVATPVVWVLAWLILALDPFELAVWIRD